MSGRDDERMDARPDEEIEHGQVILRRYREDDLDAIVQAVTDSADHLRPWLPWAVNYSRESAAEFLARLGPGLGRGHGLQLRGPRVHPPRPGHRGVGVVWRLTRPALTR